MFSKPGVAMAINRIIYIVQRLNCCLSSLMGMDLILNIMVDDGSIRVTMRSVSRGTKEICSSQEMFWHRVSCRSVRFHRLRTPVKLL